MARTNGYDKYLTEEDKIQIGVIQYVTLQYPKALIHHAANEGKRSRFEQYKAKKLGLRKGFPDLLIILNGISLALELKSSKGIVSPEQKEWLQQLQKNGYKTATTFGFDAAKDVIDTTFKN